MISITPISGMTLTTLIVTAVALSALGLRGESGHAAGAADRRRRLHGAVDVGLARHAVQDRATGSAPRRAASRSRTSSARSLASAATTAVILLMARVYGFSPGARAPEPAAGAAAQRDGGGAARRDGRPAARPGSSTALGAVFAVAAEMCGVSGLAFALGMYLPMELNSPLVLGAAVAWLLAPLVEGRAARRRPPREGHARRLGLHRRRRAGGRALGAAALRRGLDGEGLRARPDGAPPGSAPGSRPGATGTASAVFLLLGAGVYWYSRRGSAVESGNRFQLRPAVLVPLEVPMNRRQFLHRGSLAGGAALVGAHAFPRHLYASATEKRAQDAGHARQDRHQGLEARPGHRDERRQQVLGPDARPRPRRRRRAAARRRRPGRHVLGPGRPVRHAPARARGAQDREARQGRDPVEDPRLDREGDARRTSTDSARRSAPT